MAAPTEVPLRARAAGGIVRGVTLRPLAALSATLLLAVAPAAASARGGDDDEVRARGTCGGGAKSELKVKADDGGIELEFEVEHVRRGSSWKVTVVHEGRVVWRGTRRAGRAGRGSGEFEVERQLRDLAGADRFRVRASGPGGVTCRVAATLRGD